MSHTSDYSDQELVDKRNWCLDRIKDYEHFDNPFLIDEFRELNEEVNRRFYKNCKLVIQNKYRRNI